MKIKLDENLPGSLIDSLTTLCHEVETVHQEGLQGKEDAIVWRTAQKEGRFLITQDLDFSDIRQFEPGTHAGLMLVRLHAPGRMALEERIRSVFENEKIELWSGRLVVVTDLKIRVRTTKAQAQDNEN